MTAVREQLAAATSERDSARVQLELATTAHAVKEVEWTAKERKVRTVSILFAGLHLFFLVVHILPHVTPASDVVAK